MLALTRSGQSSISLCGKNFPPNGVGDDADERILTILARDAGGPGRKFAQIVFGPV